MLKIYKDKSTGKYFMYLDNELIDLDSSTVEYMKAIFEDLVSIEEANIYKTIGTEVEKMQEINEKIENLKNTIFSYYNLLSENSKNSIIESLKYIIKSLESYQKVVKELEKQDKNEHQEGDNIWTRIKKKFTSMKNRLLRKN